VSSLAGEDRQTSQVRDAQVLVLGLWFYEPFRRVADARLAHWGGRTARPVNGLALWLEPTRQPVHNQS